jgi:uncharacterized protein (TIGR02678 family)
VSASFAPTARAAVQLEPAQLEDMQRAARILLAHPMVTERWPRAGALVSVRRWEGVLRTELDRVLGYRLDVGRTCARLYRRPATLVANRGALTGTGRPLGRLGCSSLCLVLASVEGLGEQTTASQIAEEVQRLRAGDDALPVDLTRYDQRRAFVDALQWLEARGVLVLRDGELDRWLSGDRDGDALYDLDQDVVSRLLVASPSVLRDVDTVEDFLAEPLGPSDDARTRVLRHRISRRIVTEPVVSLADLDPAELAHFRHRRTRIVRDLEQLTGGRVEVRAEGVLLVDDGDLSGEAFPGTGTETQAALLWSTALVGAAAPVPASDVGLAPSPWLRVSEEAAAATWQTVVDGYRSRFRTEYREEPARLRVAVEQLLGRFGLLRVVDGTLYCHAALARYRPEHPASGGAVAEPDLWSGGSA